MVLMLHSNILYHMKEGIPQIGNALLLISVTQLILLRAHIFYYQMYRCTSTEKTSLNNSSDIILFVSS